MDTASTGVPELDEVLGGLYWGDNVVWEPREGASIEPFYRAIAALAPRYDFAAYVSLTRTPEAVLAAYPALGIIDARPGMKLEQPGPLLRALWESCQPRQRILLLFDPLDAMAERWGTETARRFFARSCPLLLELGAIAYWSLRGERVESLWRGVEEMTQCVVVVDDERLRIVKAEGRRPGVEGTVFRYRVGNGRAILAPAPAAARLGAALRAVRLQRRLRKSDIARMAGVSPSAISQAESGRRGLSLETLLELTAQLNITLDEFLRGAIAPGYRLARRHDPRQRADKPLLPLLDDPQVGLRAYLLCLPPGGSTSSDFAHKGLELIAVASGLVQVVLPTGRPVLRPGEVLLAERDGIASCRNLSNREAMVFWILRDETARPVVEAAAAGRNLDRSFA